MNHPAPPRFRPFSFRRLLLGAAVCLSAPAADAQTLLSHYTLDGDGTDGGSVGVNGALSGGAAYGAGGSGVGNFDRALSTADGTNDFFVATTANNAAFGLNAITIALWVNIDEGASTDRLVSSVNASTGFDFYIQNYTVGGGGGSVDSFNLAFGFNSTSGAVQSASEKYVSDKWLFLAVTYDATSGDVLFYSGDEGNGVALNTSSSKAGSISASTSNLEIGGTPATGADRSPVALFNDVRVYDGALTLSQLEAIRTTAIIPEPSQYALLFGMLSVGMIGMARTRRRSA
jgi:hypothetical protein